MSNTGNEIKIELDIESYNKIVRAMNQITGKSAEFIMASAANRILKTTQRQLIKADKREYVGEFKKGTKERSSTEKAKVSAGITSASVNFKSKIPGISKFYLSRMQTPTKWTKGHEINVPVAVVGGKTIYRRVKRERTTFNVPVGQIKGIRKPIKKAFKMLLHNIKKDGTAGGDHLLLGYRDKDNKKDIQEVFGSSDRSRIRNEKVYGKEEAELGKRYLDECMKRLDAALAKVR
jgi:hypothetical protein